MAQVKSICSLFRGFALGLCLFSTSQPFSASAEERESLRYTRTVLAIKNSELAVVNIEGNKPATTTASARSDAPQVNGMGAGVIVDPRGYILTNQHVVQDVGRIEVTLHDGRQFVGSLIARDSETDLAIVKVDTRSQALPSIDCGTSADLMRGEPVIAIGNPFGYHHTVTEGIISALHRDIPVNGIQEYRDLIQTDASINPGNSGGPLLNADGNMIGINAAVRIGAQGIGFAIPIDRATNVAADMLIESRRHVFASPIQTKLVFRDNQTRVEVTESSASDIVVGDVITKVGGLPIRNRLDYELALVEEGSGDSLELEVLRHGQQNVALLRLEPAQTRAQLTSSNTAADQLYRTLGLRLEPADPAEVKRIDGNYDGGLRVTGVRTRSPAAVAQIQNGDILVALMEWQTANWKDLSWVMKSNEMRSAGNAKFYIMRNNAVFFGTMDMSHINVR
ncbi:MAG: trypsin-like peptidase domain-containing protein [Planctomycetales bacterium]|nr:trypsin-like peptidase domain-containing protein [Planctomycetales bacterium]